MYVLFFMPKGRKDFIIMKKSKRIIALLLSVLMITGALFISPMTASAADITVNMIDTGWDEAAAPNMWNGGTISGNHNFFILYISSSQMLYCIEPGQPLSGGEGMNINNYVNKLHTPSIKEDGVVTAVLGRLFQYVDYGASGSPLTTDKGKALHIAVQVLVWEVTQGERDEDFKYVAPPSGYDRVKRIVNNSNMSATHKDRINDYYSDLVDKVQSHHTIPSFSRMSQSNAPTHELTDNGGTLSTTLTDNNGVLANYDYSVSGSNITFSRSGNKLTVNAKNGFEGDVTVTLTSKNTNRRGVICYGDGKGGRQDTVSIGSPIDDPVKAILNRHKRSDKDSR